MSGFCMEGVIPPQACINSSQRYQLHAGEAFSVIGSVSGFVHPIIENSIGECVRDPMASRLSIGRIPLVPHEPGAPDTLLACDPDADPVTGQRMNGTFDPNPCLATVDHTEVVTSYGPDPSNPQNQCLATGSSIVERQVTGVRFRNRNMNFTLVDPVHPGDRTCIGDRLGTLDPAGTPGQIPHVVPGYTLTFRQIGGFAPLKLFDASGEDRLSFPVKVVRGPAGSMWVVDEGDFLSSSVSSASTRGRVLRTDPLVPRVTSAIKTLPGEL
jgi:hypothetical protein